MLCHSCGKENSSTVHFCSTCGVELPSADATALVEVPRVSFISAVQTCFRKYFDFNGRATRAEFWWFYLFELLISAIALGFDAVIGTTGMMGLMGLLEFVVFLAILAPSLAVGARRLHDINKTGWWQFSAILIIPIIFLIIWWVRRGNNGSNEYGPDPRTSPS